jgi:hypothetical protein
MTGKAYVKFQNGSEYIGRYVNNVMEGIGMYTDSEGNKFKSFQSVDVTDPNKVTMFSKNDGSFVKGKIDGIGQIVYKNSNYYKGNMKGSKRDGKGMMRYQISENLEIRDDVGVYNGNWKRDQRTGMGKMNFDDKWEFNGDWRNGKLILVKSKHAQFLPIFLLWFYLDQMFYGKYIWNEDSVYIGSFLNGKFGGEGQFIFPSGLIAWGNFTDGELDKNATLKFESGDVFEGDIIDYRIGNKGKMTYKNGDIYEGYFEDEKRQGLGTLYYKNGSKYIGRFEAENKSGYGREYNPNINEYYEGYVDNDYDRENQESR